jgi:hypothetical protein
MKRFAVIALVVSAVTVVSVTVLGTVVLLEGTPDVAAVNSAPAAPLKLSPSVVPAYTPLDDAAIAALPEAIFDAVIPGLLPYRAAAIPEASMTTYRINVDQPLYGADRVIPVARFAAKNFLVEDSVIVPVSFEGDWALVLTPSRQTLPSENPDAPAQTVGWMPAAALEKVQDLTLHVVVSISEETVSIVDESGTVLEKFAAGVGAPGTPTPTGVVGYLQARYLDPAQNQETYPIVLTSLHSDAADEPYRGSDGGLIGMHYQVNRQGGISAGCVRLGAEAMTALNALPLGTPIMLSP